MHLQLQVESARLTFVGDDGVAAWSIGVDGVALERAAFREAFLWQRGAVACVGAAEHVWLFELASGAHRLHLGLDELHPSSLFGHFGQGTLGDGTELLFVLTYTDVVALDTSLSIRWTARDLAVDGLVGASECTDGDLLVVHAEMDPPGGWFEVTLDARTGRELGRKPAFLPEYVGICGAGTSSPHTC